MIRDGAAKSFTRGWETFSHFAAMLKASMARHVMTSLLVGLVVGTSCVALDLGPRRCRLLPEYIVAEISGEPTVTMSAEFGERRLEFIARQWLARVVLIALSAGALGLALIVRHGRRQLVARRRRGVRLRNIEDDRRAATSRRFGAVLFASVLVSLGIEVTRLRGAPLSSLGDYVNTAGALTIESWGVFVSPERDGRRVWISSVADPRFVSTSSAYGSLRDGVFGESLGRLIGAATIRWVGVLILLLVVLRIHAGRRGSTYDVNIVAGVPLEPGKECYHLLVCGSPGAGKSTAIKDLLLQVRNRGQRAIVYDLSGEYVQLFYREGIDKLLNPLDARTEQWHPWAEVRETVDYANIAAALFPPEGREPFWSHASAVLFASVASKLSALGCASNVALLKLLTRTPLDELHAFLEGTDAARLVDPGAGAMPANLIATMTAKLRPFALLADSAATDTDVFSIRDFIANEGHEEDSWLFLSMGEAHVDAMKPLVSLWADLAATALLSLPIESGRTTWCVLDEVASLQKLPALPGLLERGRKHGAAVILGLQSMAQLKASYGPHPAAALASQPQTWLVLRSVEPDTAKWLERALGTVEVDEAQASISMGTSPHRDGVSLAQRTVERPIVLASEIGSLRDLHGFLKLPGGRDVYRVCYDITKHPIIAAPFVPLKTEFTVGDRPRGLASSAARPTPPALRRAAVQEARRSPATPATMDQTSTTDATSRGNAQSETSCDQTPAAGERCSRFES